MQSSSLILYADAVPFQAFDVYMADGRNIRIPSPEMVMVGEHALTLWLLHSGGAVEALDGASITSLVTVGSADPNDYIGRDTQKDDE